MTGQLGIQPHISTTGLWFSLRTVEILETLANKYGVVVTRLEGPTRLPGATEKRSVKILILGQNDLSDLWRAVDKQLPEEGP